MTRHAISDRKQRAIAAIINRLAQGSARTGELVVATSWPQPELSKLLRQLERDGLIECLDRRQPGVRPGSRGYKYQIIREVIAA